MRNIGIIIRMNGAEVTSYTSDLLPMVGDSVLVNDNRYVIVDRLFIADKNKVVLEVEKLEVML